MDAATKEQADQQPTLQQEEDEDAEKLKEDEEVPMDVDDEELQVGFNITLIMLILFEVSPGIAKFQQKTLI